MSKFGVREMSRVLKDRGITVPSNVLPYGFSSPNQRSARGNLTLQQDKERRLSADVAQLARKGFPIVWFMHLDDRARRVNEAIHESDTPNSVRIFWLRVNDTLALNVTEHPVGVGIDVDELTQAEIARYAAWRPDEMATLRSEVEAEAEPRDATDDRKRMLRSIVVREGQAGFRASLIAAYQGRCAVTGNDCADVLEAAHIRPYSGPHSNVTTNGILLRADVHVLFDLGLLAISPDDLTVRIASKLRASAYGSLHEKQLVSVPAVHEKPDTRALAQHQRGAMLMHAFA